jgi:hypothetical protein
MKMKCNFSLLESSQPDFWASDVWGRHECATFFAAATNGFMFMSSASSETDSSVFVFVREKV